MYSCSSQDTTDKNLRSRVRLRGLFSRAGLARLFIACVLFSAQTLPLMANPVDGVVSAGSATIDSAGNTLTVTQATDKAVIDWRGFDIAHSETTNFVQPSSTSMTLNRVNSGAPSFINGNLNANGNLIVVNPNGVWFGSGARVDVNSLIATTAGISNDAFMNSTGNLVFDQPGNPDAGIMNDGLITAKEAGLVGLVAPNVINRGVIVAKMGRVHLASGDTATVDMYGDGLLNIAVSDAVKSQLVANSGIIAAEGGTIALTAAAGKDIVNSLVKVGGELHAPSISQRNGKIIIAAAGSNKTGKQGSSTVLVDGVVNASGHNTGERGGSISITGDNIALLKGTWIDASGSDGLSGTTLGQAVSALRVGSAGGDIRIGGDYLGQGDTPTALNLYVDSGALILNDAINSGDAGRTIFWSDGTTRFYGNVYARALGGKPVDTITWNATLGGNSGNGGFVETSGHVALDVGGYVDLTASNGDRGTYFMDPSNITIYGNFAPNYATVIQGDATALSASLKLWLDASDTANVRLTYSALTTAGVNSCASSCLTASGTSGASTITTSANIASTLSVGQRIRLGSAGSVTAASTLGADTYTIASISGTTITLSAPLSTTYTNATVYAGYISQLTDKSGQANNAVQPTAANMPLWVSGGQNGLGVAYFDGTAYKYLGMTASTLANTFSYWAVLQTSVTEQIDAQSTSGTGGTAGENLLLSPTHRTADGGSGLSVGTNGISVYEHGTGYMPSVNVYNSTIGSGYNAIGVTYVSKQSTLSLNGSNVNTGVTSTEPNVYADYTIGASNYSFPSGNFAETFRFNTNLSTNAQALLNQYQSAKWNIALTPPGSGATEAAKATAAIQKGDAVDGYSVFTTRYLERLSQSANISLQASNNITLDFQGDTMNFATAGRSLTLTAGNQITTASTGTITTNGGDINMYANDSIAFNNAFTLNSNGGNILLNADRDASGAGAINLGSASINSSGGNITMGGGNGTITSGTGFAVGTSTYKHGVYLNASTITASGGNIILNGTGYANSGCSNNCFGQSIVGTTISTTGSGSISIYGIGGGTGATVYNSGVQIQNNSSVTAASGNINLTGQVTETGTGAVALSVYGTANIQTTVAGDINLVDVGSLGRGFTGNVGTNTLISAHDINYTGNFGFVSGNVFTWNAAGTILIKPYTASTTVGVGTGSGTLAIPTNYLTQMTAASYVFGSTNSGNMAIITTRDFVNSNVSFISGGNITLGGTLTKATGTGTATYLLQANSAISNTSGMGITASTGAINLTLTSNVGAGGGAVTLTSAGLNVNGGTITINSNGSSVTQSGTIGGNETITSSNGAVSIGMLDGDTAGTRSLTVSAGTATFTTTGVIGATNKLNNLSITADDVVLGGNVNGSGTLTLKPATTTRLVKINNGTADGTNFNLSTTEIGYFVDGWSGIVIGDAATSVDTTIGATTWTDPVTFQSNYRKYIYGLTGTGNASFTVTGGWADLLGNITTAGGALNLSGMGTYLWSGTTTAINTNGGAISFKQIQVNSTSGNMTVNSGNANISVTDRIYGSNTKLLTLNAGTGALSFSNTVNDVALTASANSMTFSGAWGGTGAMGDVSLTSVASLSLPAITLTAGKSLTVSVTGASNSITTTGAIAVGAAGNITFTADDLILGGNLSGTGILTLQPTTLARTVNINNGAPTGSDFNLSTTELGYFVDGWSEIDIGNTGSTTHSINVGAATFNDNLVLRTPSGGYINNAVSMIGGSTFRSTSNLDIVSTSITTDGGSVTIGGQLYASSGNIVTNGGNVTISNGLATWNSAPGGSITTSGGNITVSGSSSEFGPSPSGTRAYTLNAGAGAITFNGTINGNISYTLTGGSVNFNGNAIGGTIPVADLSITSVASVSLPAITTAAGKSLSVSVTGASNTITTTGAISVGAAGNLTFTGDDLILGGNLTGTGTLTIQPTTSASQAMRIGGSYTGSTAGYLTLQTSEINYIQAGWSSIVLGATSGGTTSNIGTSTWLSSVTFRPTSGFFNVLASAVVTGNANITFSGAPNIGVGSSIIANSGTVSFSGNVNLSNNSSITAQNISFAMMLLYGNTTLTASNNLTLGNTNFLASMTPYNLTASAATISLTGNMGVTSPLNNVSLTSTNGISLPSISAANIFVQTTGASADVTIASGKTLTATGTGTAITLAAGRNFINNAGSGALSTPSGRWLVYSSNPASDTVGGLSNSFRRFSCTYGGSCPTMPGSGNGLLYTTTPVLTITPNTLSSIVYGAAAPNLSGYAYTVSGYLGSDAAADSLTGSLTGSSNYVQGSNVGTYYINYGLGTLASAMGYSMSYANNASAISVTQRSITISADAKNKVYGASDPSLTYRLTSGSLYNADTIIGALSRVAGENVGTYGISRNTLSAGSNYAITYIGNNLSITAAPVTNTAQNSSVSLNRAIPVTVTRVSQDPTLVMAGSVTGTANTNTFFASSPSVSKPQTGTTSASDKNNLPDKNDNITVQTVTALPNIGDIWLKISPELAAILGTSSALQ